MGYFAHHAVVMESWNPDDFAPVVAWRDQLEDKWRGVIVGPIGGVVNGNASMVMVPDGSKEWWADSERGDELRAELVALCRAHGISFVEVRFGGDDPDMAAIVHDCEDDHLDPDEIMPPPTLADLHGAG